MYYKSSNFIIYGLFACAIYQPSLEWTFSQIFTRANSLLKLLLSHLSCEILANTMFGNFRVATVLGEVVTFYLGFLLSWPNIWVKSIIWCITSRDAHDLMVSRVISPPHKNKNMGIWWFFFLSMSKSSWDDNDNYSLFFLKKN